MSQHTKFFLKQSFGLLLLASITMQSELDDVASILVASNAKMDTECFAKKIHIKSINQTRTMDVIKMVPLDNLNQKYIGTFHVGGVGTEGRSATFMATTENGPCGDWTVIDMIAQQGSMGFLYPDLNSNSWYFAYEHEGNGNTIGIRHYASYNELLKNNFTYEYQLKKQVHVATDPNTYTPKPVNVKNVGTPSIEKIEGDVMFIKFHYYPETGTNDQPGSGTVNLRSADTGLISDYPYWYGHFDNNVNNAIRVAGGIGKIGGRDSFLYNNHKYYVYESQLNDDPNGDSRARWASWRLFLHSDEVEPNRAVKLGFVASDDKIIDFANPHVAISGGKFILYSFIPGEGDKSGSKFTGDYIRVFDFDGKALVKRKFLQINA